MSLSSAKKIVKQYAEKLKVEHYPFSAVYLYGSYAKGKAHKWSDIDVAVISGKLRRNNDKNRFLLWKLRRGIDSRIEPLGFTPEDFANEANPMAYEIKKSGIRVA